MSARPNIKFLGISISVHTVICDSMKLRVGKEKEGQGEKEMTFAIVIYTGHASLLPVDRSADARLQCVHLRRGGMLGEHLQDQPCTARF